jgi:hypothetical protein
MGPVNDAIEFDDPMGWQHSRIDLKMRLRQRMPVLVHQFTIDRNGITQTPTGWRRDSSGSITKGTDRDFDLDHAYLAIRSLLDR